MNDRVTDLEVKVAFQDDLLEALNQTVAAQQRQLDLLQDELRLIYQQIKSLQAAGLPAEPVDETPPHY